MGVSEGDGGPNRRNRVENGAVGGGRAPEGSLGPDEAGADQTGQTEGRAVVGGGDAPEHPVSSAVIGDADLPSIVGASGRWMDVKKWIKKPSLR